MCQSHSPLPSSTILEIGIFAYYEVSHQGKLQLSPQRIESQALKAKLRAFQGRIENQTLALRAPVLQVSTDLVDYIVPQRAYVIAVT